MAKTEKALIHAYLQAAYRQEFGADPNKIADKRLKEAASSALEDYRTSNEGPVVISLPFIYVMDVVHPKTLCRSLSRDQFQRLLD